MKRIAARMPEGELSLKMARKESAEAIFEQLSDPFLDLRLLVETGTREEIMRHIRGFFECEEKVCPCPVCLNVVEVEYNAKVHKFLKDDNCSYPERCGKCKFQFYEQPENDIFWNASCEYPEDDTKLQALKKFLAMERDVAAILKYLFEHHFFSKEWNSDRWLLGFGTEVYWCTVCVRILFVFDPEDQYLCTDHGCPCESNQRSCPNYWMKKCYNCDENINTQCHLCLGWFCTPKQKQCSVTPMQGPFRVLWATHVTRHEDSPEVKVGDTIHLCQECLDKNKATLGLEKMPVEEFDYTETPLDLRLNESSCQL
jgi:hypothetical protein